MKKTICCSVILLWVSALMGAILPGFADSVVFDQSQLDKGVVRVKCESDKGEALKIMIQREDKKYVYELKAGGAVEAFPLQMGNGDYTVTVLKNITGSKYAPIASQKVTLDLSDSKTVFLQSIQNICWDMNTKAVLKAKELISGFREGSVKIQAVYDYVVTHLTYDFTKAKNVQSGYIPVVDETYDSGKGICYDYASLFASMLRAEGVPVKLVKGFTKNVEGYHAWNEVYDEKTDKWIVVDTTIDSMKDKGKDRIQLQKERELYQDVNSY